MRKHEHIQWSVEWAASEFGLNPRTLVNRLRRQGISPDAAGKFTTRQICAAVYGDLDGARLAKVQAEARLAEVKALEAEGALVPPGKFADAIRRTVEAIRAVILSASNLEDEDKDKILLACRDAISEIELR